MPERIKIDRNPLLLCWAFYSVFKKKFDFSSFLFISLVTLILSRVDEREITRERRKTYSLIGAARRSIFLCVVDRLLQSIVESRRNIKCEKKLIENKSRERRKKKKNFQRKFVKFLNFSKENSQIWIVLFLTVQCILKGELEYKESD